MTQGNANSSSTIPPKEVLAELSGLIPVWARELGFQKTGISDTSIDSEGERLSAWLEKDYHGEMAWLADNKELRLSPEKLVPKTRRVISVRMDYLPPETNQIATLKSLDKAYLSRYALGRDYHKLIRKRLAKLSIQITNWLEDKGFTTPPNQRPFVDSAPVMERPFASKAGLGWVGKHTLILDEDAGSWFFLGELFTSLPLPLSGEVQQNRCGECVACMKICPTDAFPRPYELDARRCISYLTIENKRSIPEEFREPMGNRVFGCDDCQLICPWNKYAKPTDEADFHPRHQLDDISLLELFNWDESTFDEKTAGSPIRRIGFERWRRNLAVGLGNAPSDSAVIRSLEEKKIGATDLVAEHIDWALQQQTQPNRRRKRKIKRKME